MSNVTLLSQQLFLFNNVESNQHALRAIRHGARSVCVSYLSSVSTFKRVFSAFLTLNAPHCPIVLFHLSPPPLHFQLSTTWFQNISFIAKAETNNCLQLEIRKMRANAFCNSRINKLDELMFLLTSISRPVTNHLQIMHKLISSCVKNAVLYIIGSKIMGILNTEIGRYFRNFTIDGERPKIE